MVSKGACYRERMLLWMTGLPFVTVWSCKCASLCCKSDCHTPISSGETNESSTSLLQYAVRKIYTWCYSSWQLTSDWSPSNTGAT